MDADALEDRFEEHRPHLRAVAYRMLGSVSEADDAVQERRARSRSPTRGWSCTRCSSTAPPTW